MEDFLRAVSTSPSETWDALWHYCMTAMMDPKVIQAERLRMKTMMARYGRQSDDESRDLPTFKAAFYDLAELLHEETADTKLRNM